MNLKEFRDSLDAVLKEAETAFPSIKTPTDYENIKASILGRNGKLTHVTAELKNIAKEDKPEAGKSLNHVKQKVEELLSIASEKIRGNSTCGTESIDVTLPGRQFSVGRKHPITQTIDDCVAIFRRMGFIVAEGPDIETVYHCFDALNTPLEHPSRDKSDTFYFPDGRILRTQTSTVQIRVMESQEPPVRIIAPGPCFRVDTPDATHSANFHQVEGLYVDKNVSLADLKSTILHFARELLGESVNIRFRPHFFPFTEPSVEYDFSCVMCGGKGCGVCKYSGWLEISGAGMVDPNVLRNVGYDPAIWSGFAWGMGVERIAMIRHRINDIRLLYDNDVRFLNQF